MAPWIIKILFHTQVCFQTEKPQSIPGRVVIYGRVPILRHTQTCAKWETGEDSNLISLYCIQSIRHTPKYQTTISHLSRPYSHYQVSTISQCSKSSAKPFDHFTVRYGTWSIVLMLQRFPKWKFASVGLPECEFPSKRFSMN